MFDDAVIRTLFADAYRPKPEAKRKASDTRPALDMAEIRALVGSFDAWIERARTDKSKEMPTLLRDYVHVLLDTGAWPGDELLNLKWKQIKLAMKPTITETNEVDEEGDNIELDNLNRSLEITISGKTGTRTTVAMLQTVKALTRIT